MLNNNNFSSVITHNQFDQKELLIKNLYFRFIVKIVILKI